MQTPTDIHLYAARRVPAELAMKRGAMAEQYINDELRAVLAENIRRAHMQKSVDREFIDYRIDVYVADADTFWRIVNETARRIAIGYPV